MGSVLQVLAKKMTVLYKLAQKQLSKQSHYDFGLRALKSVLVMAGELKRGSPELNEVSTHSSVLSHDLLSESSSKHLELTSLSLFPCVRMWC